MAVFRLEALLSARAAPPETPPERAARRVAFGKWIASLLAGTRVEFRFVALPGQRRPVESVAVAVLVTRTPFSQPETAQEETERTLRAFLPSLRAHFPDAEFTPASSKEEISSLLNAFPLREGWVFRHARIEIPLKEGLPRPARVIGFGGRDARNNTATDERIETVVPWTPTGSTWHRLCEALYWSPVPLALRIVAQPAPLRGARAEEDLNKAIARCEGLVPPRGEGLLSPLDAQMVRGRLFERRNSLFQSSLLLSVGLFGPEPVPREIASIVQWEISGSRPESDDPLAVGAGTVECVPASHAEFDSGLNVAPAAVRLEDLFSAQEVAGALRLPDPPGQDLHGFSVRTVRTNMASPELAFEGPGSLFLGYNIHRGIETPVHLSLEERRRHVYIVGQTGTGKSTLLERMILQDIRAGRGLALIDPHGDLVENVLSRMPRERADDVLVIDLSDSEQPVGLNPIQWSTLEERDFLVEELIASLISKFNREATGPIWELHTRNFLKLLMGDGPRPDYVPNLLDFPLLYQRPHFRKYLVSTMQDETVVDFVREAEANRNSEHSLSSIASYVTSKLSRFIGSAAVRRTLGQSRSAVDFREAMDSGQIILVSVAKGRVGELSASTITSLLVARFRAAAMSRATVPIEERRDFTLYVDEFHNVASSTYAELLSEARKYRLGLVLANQYIAQLPEEVIQSILGNVGCLFCFRVGAADAQRLEHAFTPVFSAGDLVDLPILHACVSSLVGGEVSTPFSVRCVRDSAVRDSAQAAEIRRRSRERWGVPAAKVDAEIRERRAWIERLT